MLAPRHRIPLEVAHHFLATFGITEPSRVYERWVKDDGFDFQDFPVVLGESPYIFRIDWRAALPDELAPIADALSSLGVKMQVNVAADEDRGQVDCQGRTAQVKYVVSDEDDFTNVIAAIQAIVPEGVEFRASPDNAGSDTWEFAVLPGDEWEDLRKSDEELLASLFVPMENR